MSRERASASAQPPALRQGFLVVPPELVERLKGVKLIADRQTPVLDQHVLARFITEGHLAVHLRRMRTIYARRRAALLESLRRYATTLLEVGETPEVGMHIVARLRARADDVAISRYLLQRQIHAAPLSQFYAGSTPLFGFVLGFAGTCDHQIRPAVRELARAVEMFSITSPRPRLRDAVVAADKPVTRFVRRFAPGRI